MFGAVVCFKGSYKFPSIIIVYFVDWTLRAFYKTHL